MAVIPMFVLSANLLLDDAARLELDRDPLADRDLLARPWVAALPWLPLLHREGAEVAQLYPALSGKDADDGIQIFWTISIVSGWGRSICPAIERARFFFVMA